MEEELAILKKKLGEKGGCGHFWDNDKESCHFIGEGYGVRDWMRRDQG